MRGTAVGSCDLLFKHLCALVAVEFQQMDTKPREHTRRMQWIEVRDIETSHPIVRVS